MPDEVIQSRLEIDWGSMREEIRQAESIVERNSRKVATLTRDSVILDRVVNRVEMRFQRLIKQGVKKGIRYGAAVGIGAIAAELDFGAEDPFLQSLTRIGSSAIAGAAFGALSGAAGGPAGAAAGAVAGATISALTTTVSELVHYMRRQDDKVKDISKALSIIAGEFSEKIEASRQQYLLEMQKHFEERDKKLEDIKEESHERAYLQSQYIGRTLVY